jgi:hypothetical protein
MLRHTAFKYRAAGKTFNPDPGACISARMMSCGVSADRQEFKVLQSIVGLVVVPVVNVLVTSETPTKVLLHDDTMFKQVSTADAN